MSTVQTLVIHLSKQIIWLALYMYLQAQYMFVFDTLLESIKHEVYCITGPTNIAKEKLNNLAKVNVTIKMSGYESQFKVKVK